MEKINNYNPGISRACNANVDSRYVWDSYESQTSRCTKHIVSDIAKSENELCQEVKQTPCSYQTE